MMLINITFIKFIKRLHNAIYTSSKLKIENNIDFDDIKILNNLKYFSL